MGHSHSHTHGHIDEADTQSERYRDTIRVTLIGSVVDLLLGVAKILVGFVAQSQALIADGVHSLSDLATDFVVLYAAKHSHQEADDEHPYGHGRFETVATVGLGIALIGVAVGLSIDALRRLFNPESLLEPGVWALVVAVISILSKEAIYHYTMVVAKKHNSNMLRANAWHSRSDAISSVIVVVGVAGSMAGLWYLDALAAIGVGLMVAKIGWDLAWHSVKELVDTGLDPERVEVIRQAILGVDGVDSLHILRTRRMGADALVDVHIQVNPQLSISEAHFISETVRKQVISDVDEVCDVMVHTDPEDDEIHPLNLKLPNRSQILEMLQQHWQDIAAAGQIEKTTLHYLQGGIQVELLLPLSVLDSGGEKAQQELAGKFEAAVSQIDEVDSIRLRFH